MFPAKRACFSGTPSAGVAAGRLAGSAEMAGKAMLFKYSLCSRSEMKRQRYRNSSNSFRSRVFYVSTVPSKLRSNEAPALRHDGETTHGGITTVAGFARESSAFRRSAYRGSKMPPLSAVPKSTKHLPKTLRFPPTCHPLFPPSSPREPSAVSPRHLAGPSVSEAWNWRDFC